MGCVMTGIPEIDNLTLVEIPKNKAIQVIAIRYENTIVFKIDDYHFSIARSEGAEKWAFPMSFERWAWQKGFINALEKLRLISRPTVTEICDRVKERDRKAAANSDLGYMDEISKKYGFSLSAAQRKKIK